MRRCRMRAPQTYIHPLMEDGDIAPRGYWSRAGLKPASFISTTSMEALREMVQPTGNAPESLGVAPSPSVLPPIYDRFRCKRCAAACGRLRELADATRPAAPAAKAAVHLVVARPSPGRIDATAARRQLRATPPPWRIEQFLCWFVTWRRIAHA